MAKNQDKKTKRFPVGGGGESLLPCAGFPCYHKWRFPKLLLENTLQKHGFSSTHGPYSMQKLELPLFYIMISITQMEMRDTEST